MDDHTHTHSHGSHGHHHVHSDEEKKAVLNRLSRAIGHLESVRRMVERDEDCSEVLKVQKLSISPHMSIIVP